jgi:hypothetical protein
MYSGYFIYMCVFLVLNDMVQWPLDHILSSLLFHYKKWGFLVHCTCFSCIECYGSVKNCIDRASGCPWIHWIWRFCTVCLCIILLSILKILTFYTPVYDGTYNGMANVSVCLSVRPSVRLSTLFPDHNLNTIILTVIKLCQLVHLR